MAKEEIRVGIKSIRAYRLDRKTGLSTCSRVYRILYSVELASNISPAWQLNIPGTVS